VKRARRPVLITDAELSPAEELRRRQTRYIVMMLLRTLCLILAAVLAGLQVPLLGLWVLLCLIGAVVLPWLAVVLANNRMVKPQYRLFARRRAGSTAESAQPALSARVEPPVIDAEP
jgi:Flp pilus assembly protein TadB